MRAALELGMRDVKNEGSSRETFGFPLAEAGNPSAESKLRRDGDFEAVGDQFLKYFVEFGRLSPANRVLDVGSGIRRMARPLTKYLATGSYEGIEIVPQGIDWRQKNISKRFPDFRFQLADVRTLMYNPRGRFEAAEYQFPFGDGDFDFTCLRPLSRTCRGGRWKHYQFEIARTSRAGGSVWQLISC